jgi:DNA-binding MarR family transcriptional regulator
VQFNVLHLLADSGGMRPSDLTEALVVDASSTTYLIDRMEALGWIRRLEDRTDRRAWQIVMTPEGRKLHARVAPLYEAALRETLRGLDPTRINPMAQALGEIQQAAHAAVGIVLAHSPARPGKSSSHSA